MTLIKISEDGLAGRRKHPFINPTICKSDVTMDQVDDYVALVRDFEANNQPYPLTEPGEPNSEVEAELVWQWQSIYGGWDNLQFGETIEDYAKNNFNTRQVWQISKLKVERPPTAEVTEQSSDEDISHLAGLPLSEIYLHGIIAGKDIRIKKLTSKVMAERDKVVELIETTAKEYAAEIDLDLLSKKGIKHNEIRIQLLTDLLTKIKALKS